MFVLVYAIAVLPMAAVFGGLFFHTLCCMCWRTGGPLGLVRPWAWCVCVVWWWCAASSVLLCTCVLHTIHSPFKSLHTILFSCGVTCCVYLTGCVKYLLLLTAAYMCEYGHTFCPVCMRRAGVRMFSRPQFLVTSVGAAIVVLFSFTYRSVARHVTYLYLCLGGWC